MRKGQNLRVALEVTKHLDTNAERYSVIVPGSEEMRNLSAWLKHVFPIASWGRVDWNRVPNNICRKAESTQQQEECVIEICRSHQLRGEVVVLWTNELKPGLRMSLETFLRNVAPLAEEDWDTWIMSEADGWCIEIYHEGEVCFGHQIAV